MAFSLSEHYSIPRLIRYSIPSICGMIFTSMYTIVDGIFVSNVAGDSAFASMNLIWPACSVLQAFGFMIGAGGSALVAKTLGENKKDLANTYFSMLVQFAFLLGSVITAVMIPLLPGVARMLGATEALMPDCMRYGKVLMAFMPFIYLSVSFQSFYLVASKPKLGMIVTIGCGILNMVLDYVFMVGLQLGVMGAAFATGLNWMASAFISLFYFSRKNPTVLRLGRFHWQFKALLQSLMNGLSEMVTNLSLSFISILYNLELMNYLGSNGVNAYGVIQYVAFLFASLYLGYCMASAPLISYQYGAGNHTELRSLYTKSLWIIGVSGFFLFGIAELLAKNLALIFVSYSQELMVLTIHAIHIYAFSFLLAGFNCFASSFFTSLNNGPVSAIISFMRTFVFQAICILVLPILFGVDGIWWAVSISEVLASAISIYYLFHLRPKYGY